MTDIDWQKKILEIIDDNDKEAMMAYEFPKELREWLANKQDLKRVRKEQFHELMAEVLREYLKNPNTKP